MEKSWQYLIIFLIGWIFFIIPNEIILNNSIKNIENPRWRQDDTILDRILFSLGLFGLMLMIISYGNIKGICDKWLK